MIEAAIAKVLRDKNITNLEDKVHVMRAPIKSEADFSKTPFAVVKCLGRNYDYDGCSTHSEPITADVYIFVLAKRMDDLYDVSEEILETVDAIDNETLSITSSRNVVVQNVLLEDVSDDEDFMVDGWEALVYHKMIQLEVVFYIQKV